MGLVALWTWEQTCSVTKVREADSSPKTPRSSIHSILSPLKAVCPARKKDMGVKSVVELYNPSLLCSLLFFRHFQAIEQPSINWGAQPPPALLDPSKSI